MRRRYAVIIVVAAAVVCVWVFVVAGWMLMGVKDVRRMSAYCSLSTGLHEEVNRYYRQNGGYPESLDTVTERLGELADYEGATAEMLGDFEYEVRGDGCRLWCPVRVTYMRRGEVVEGWGGAASGD